MTYFEVSGKKLDIHKNDDYIPSEEKCDEIRGFWASDEHKLNMEVDRDKFMSIELKIIIFWNFQNTLNLSPKSQLGSSRY